MGVAMCFPTNGKGRVSTVSLGAFHYARLAGQRPVGKPKENGTTLFDQTRPTKKNGSYPFFYSFSKSLHK